MRGGTSIGLQRYLVCIFGVFEYVYKYFLAETINSYSLIMPSEYGDSLGCNCHNCALIKKFPEKGMFLLHFCEKPLYQSVFKYEPKVFANAD